MSEVAFRVSFGIIAAISVVSFVLNSIIVNNWYRYRKDQGKTVKRLLCDYVVLFSICDLLSEIKYFVSFISFAFKSGTYSIVGKIPNGRCAFYGFISQLDDIMGITFAFGLAIFVLLPLSRDRSVLTICDNKLLCNINNYAIIVVISLFLSVPLLFVKDGYGHSSPGTNNYGLDKFQCWIKDGDNDYYLFLYIFP